MVGSTPCPAGTYLDSVSSRCRACDARLVTTSTGETSCSPCPATSARTNASTCTPCPDNSRASVFNPAQCACDPDFYDTLYGVNLASPVCKACPRGGVCITGFVAADVGYWRENTQSAVFYRCRDGQCLAEKVNGPLTPPLNATNGTLVAGRRSLMQAFNATVPTNCVEGHVASHDLAPTPASAYSRANPCMSRRNTGPLCAICLPGYSMQSGQCLPCDPKDSWEHWRPGTKSVLLVFCIFGALVVIAFLFFQPVVPFLEHVAASLAAGLRSCFAGAKRKATCGYLETYDDSKSKQAAKEGENDPAVPEDLAAGDGVEGTRRESLLGSSGETAKIPAATGDEVQPHAPERASFESDPGQRKHHSSHPDHSGVVSKAQQDAMAFQLETSAAAAVGTAVAMQSVGADHADDAAGHTLDFMDNLEEIFESIQSAIKQAQKFGKLIINFYQVTAFGIALFSLRMLSYVPAQIVSTFIKSLDIPWPGESTHASVRSLLHIAAAAVVAWSRVLCR